MEKGKIKKFHIISFIFVSILGSLLHFVYDWSGENVIVGALSAVNESTWEHLKLVFYPMLITTLIGCCTLGKNISNYICARTKGILVAMSFIIIFFYVYSGILGVVIDAINILSFYIGIFIGEYVSYKNMINSKSCNKFFAKLILFVFLCSFIILTYITPEIALFMDPLTNTYGIQ